MEPGVLLAELCAFFQEAGSFGVGGFQAAKQSGVGDALAGRDRRWAGPADGVPEARDLIAALDTVSSAEADGNTQALTAALKNTKPALSWAARHPVPACADPRGYWDVLLRHVTAAADTSSASNRRAAMKGIPQIQRQLTTELKAL